MLAVGLAALTLAGCASQPRLSAEQCASADWRALGFNDGQSGQAMTALNDEIIACKEHGIEPDLEAYTAGREKGLATYCQPATLLEASLQSVGDPFVCEPMDTAQRSAFEMGRDTRAAAQRWQQMQTQYKQLTDQRDAINAEGARLSQAFNAEREPAARSQIAQRITELGERRNAVDAEIARADPVMREEQAKYDTAINAYERMRLNLAR
ncbi:MAG: DUF2799 domain-containing protein [Pseudomonadota bacterium]